MAGNSDKLQRLIDHEKRAVGASATDASDAYMLGGMVAFHLDWEPEPIIECILTMLEDANMHTLRAQVEALVEGRDGSQRAALVDTKVVDG